MRDIIDKLNLLTEATGMAGRKPGDVYRNSDGEEASFIDMAFYPNQGKLAPEELDQLINKSFSDVHWQNAKTGRTGGIAIAELSINGENVLIGRFLEQVKPSKTDNYVPNTFVINDVPWKYVGKAGKAGQNAVSKADSKLSPQDLIGQPIDLEIEDIMNQLAMSLGTDNPLYAVAHRIAMGEPLPMTFAAPEGYSFTAFRDYFCEILQPIALQRGQYTGNAGEAAKKFLGGSFQDTLISFDESKTAGLSDSIMTNAEGKFVKISTKGGKGANASAKNLIDGVNELSTTPEGKKLLNKHKEVIDLLREIQSKGQAGAPLYLGVKFGIISEDEAAKIAALKNSNLTSLKNIGSLGLSKKLQNLATERTTKNPDQVNLYYHLMAAVAAKAATAVNSKTNFSAAATEILNNGALVQVYTKASEGKDTWKLGEFNTVYPGSSIKGVYLNSAKSYYSTNIQGNFTFKIDKGAGVDKDDETEQDYTPIQSEPNAERDFRAGAEQIATGRKPRPTAGGGMRELRKK